MLQEDTFIEEVTSHDEPLGRHHWAGPSWSRVDGPPGVIGLEIDQRP